MTAEPLSDGCNAETTSGQEEFAHASATVTGFKALTPTSARPLASYECTGVTHTSVHDERS